MDPDAPTYASLTEEINSLKRLQKLHKQKFDVSQKASRAKLKAGGGSGGSRVCVIPVPASPDVDARAPWVSRGWSVSTDDARTRARAFDFVSEGTRRPSFCHADVESARRRRGDFSVHDGRDAEGRERPA